MKKQLLIVCAALLLHGPSGSAAETKCASGDFAGAMGGQQSVCQGWDEQQQLAFWFTSQGSNIIPYAWIVNLEQANSSEKFTSSANIEAYRYLAQEKTPVYNPDGLPIGFTKDEAKGNPANEKIAKHWLGLTCAACHTGQLEYAGRKVLIDGAPAMADFQAFFEDMAVAMRATLNFPDKFDRFAKAVIKANKAQGTGGATRKNVLRKQLREMTAVRERWIVRNSGGIRYGNSRLDALGSILNEVLVAQHGAIPIKEGQANAPVSYPFIWDTPQHDRVQWNGSVVNAGLGAPGRNIGEVIGVFGSLDFNLVGGKIPVNQSSVNIVHLGELEQLIWSLQSPLWNDVWKGTGQANRLDPYLTKVGRKVFAKKCQTCHNLPIDRNNRHAEIAATMVSINYINTDPTAAENFVSRAKPDGELLSASVAGVVIEALLSDKLATLKTIKAGQPDSITAVVDALAENILAGLDEAPADQKLMMVAKFIDALRQKQEEWKAEKRKSSDKKQDCSALPLCYKARPLNGVWATAPYLHNGSVRTIRQLLIPSERQITFNVGSREYDPKTLGFEDAGKFVIDTRLKGNFNTGHDFYGSYFDANRDELKGLMEYLKSL